MLHLSERDKKVLWHPYTPMKILPDSIGIVRGEGTYLIDEKGERYLDAISSWWVNLHGHAHPYIARKIHEQLVILEHCIFAGFTHEPAVALAERLLEILPKNLTKIFYSDNGSTAVEVALKMAIQYWQNLGNTKRTKIIAVENAYHGDTFGAMAVSARSVFTTAFDHLLFNVEFIPFPEPNKEGYSLEILETLLKQQDVAAFIIEPLVQGSAGMKMYSASVLESYFSLCKKYGALIIDDEVLTGFGRTGTLFAVDQIDTKPDIVCLSKGLTGGTLPMGVTAASQAIFDAFYTDNRLQMLHHGHSFTANPVGCAAALASLDLTLTKGCADNRQIINLAHLEFIKRITDCEVVENVRCTGTILAMEIKTENPSYHTAIRDKLYKYFIDRKIIMRPIGNTIYILPPYNITIQQLDYAYNCVWELLLDLSLLEQA